MLSFEDVTLRYPNSDFELGPIQLQCRPGSCIAVLGKNGAGKTSFFQLASGNLKANDGEIKLGDKLLNPTLPEIKRHIGYLPQAFELPKWVSGHELLGYAIQIQQLPNAHETRQKALAYWDSEYYAKRPLASCSHGMKKRIGLALACIHDPELLILDEPFSGLDLFHIRSLHQVIEKRRTEDKITILSTHIAPYAAKLCDHVYIMDQGKLSEVEGWSDLDYLGRTEKIETAFFGN